VYNKPPLKVFYCLVVYNKPPLKVFYCLVVHNKPPPNDFYCLVVYHRPPPGIGSHTGMILITYFDAGDRGLLNRLLPGLPKKHTSLPINFKGCETPRNPRNRYLYHSAFGAYNINLRIVTKTGKEETSITSWQASMGFHEREGFFVTLLQVLLNIIHSTCGRLVEAT